MKVLDTKTYCNIILGRDFLSNFTTVEFDFSKHRIKLGPDWHDCVTIGNHTSVKVANPAILQPRSETIVNVECSKSLSLITADFEPKSLPLSSSLYSTRCRIIPNIDGIFQLSLLNTSDKPISLPAHKHVGSVIAVEDTPVSVHQIGQESSINLNDNIVYGEHLPDDSKSAISSLISNFTDIFAQNPKKPTLVSNMQHRIITDDVQPVNRKPYRIPHAWYKKTKQQISEMLKNDIIRPSSSPWNAPVILVKKKDGSMRFVCDFWGLNDITKKDSYPLPHIRDVLDKMHGTEYWTTLDAASAYWSMPLAEIDKEKTSFSVPHGKFEFNVTPFGLCNAGASYQRLMDITLSGLASDRILGYMDDIVIFSPSFKEHLADIEQIFHRLRSSGISLKISNCVFPSHKVDFLGFELSKNGIQPQTRLTDAIRSYERPLTKKQLKGFLGLAGFYRAFIPGFATISQPLNSLTTDTVVFKCSDDCENAFKQLKEQLLSEPVLQFPNLNQPFVIEVDASDPAVGGVLSQTGPDNQPHPVAYFSTALQNLNVIGRQQTRKHMLSSPQ
eukprot:gene20882-22932_t